MRADASPSRGDRYARLALCLLVAGVYGDAACYGYINDDFDLIHLSPARAVELSLQGLFFRPVWYLSYPLTNALVQSAVLDHLVDLGLFAWVACLGYDVARRRLASARSALLAVCVWVLLPWMAFPAVWISQRNDLFLLLFTFAALRASEGTRPVASLGWMGLALLSKESALLLPVYFVGKFWRPGRRRLAAGFAALGAGYLAIVVQHYALHHARYEAPHLFSLPVPLRLLNAASHWAESLLTQVLPLPFFVSPTHAGLHVAGLALLLSAVRVRREGLDWELLWLALLASFPSVITPQLRIVGLQSYFWLLFLAGVLACERVALFRTGLALVVASHLAGVVATKRNFRTGNHDPHARAISADTYYPNEFYAKKRDLFIRLLER